ncbi:helix-turn-helix domain-containing protein [Micromonospora sp. NPDC000668]|uniref:helix-turn-helix domain-containing protein n=1 Tax=Micromonospora sp. NPDC000668 TaxID=3364219 RepID=UPI0036C102EB
MSDVPGRDHRWLPLGRQLARLRVAAGFTQHSLAPLLHYGRSTIANVEVGRQRAPRRFWERCDEVLDAGGQLVAAFDQLQRLRRETGGRSWTAQGFSGTSQVRLLQLEPTEEQEMRRREFIRATAALAVCGAAPATSTAGRRISLGDVTEHARRTVRLRRLDNYLGGADTLRHYEAELRATTSLFNTASFGSSTAKALLALLAEQTQLAGWAAFDAGDHDYATALFTASRPIAVQAEDVALAANALALLAYLRASLGQPDIATAEASSLPVSADVNPAVRALLYDRLAFTYAVAGEEKRAGAALNAAHEALNKARLDTPPDWAAWVDHDEVQIMTGRVWSELRRPLRAIPELEVALRRLDDAHARDKALYSTWLAESYLDAGELEQAAAILDRSKRLCTGVGSPRPAIRIAVVRKRLPPYQDEDAGDRREVSL